MAATVVADPSTPVTAPRSRVSWAAVLAVLVPTALVVWHATAYGFWEVDDAGITFAYARDVANGFGPVLQPGLPPVEGFSNPAWLALLVVGHWLGLFDRGTWFGVPDYVAYPKALAILLVACTFTGFYAAAKVLVRRPALVTLLAGGVLALVPSFVIWCVSGLENSLLVFAVVTQAAVLVRAQAAGTLATWRPALACGLLAALAALTRPEGMIYAAAYPIVLLLFARRHRVAASLRAAAVSLAAFAVAFGAYLLFRIVTFGQLLPTTAVAKSQGLPTIGGFAKVAELVSYGGWLAVLLGAGLVGIAVANPSRLRDGLVTLLVPLGLALTAFGVLVPDWMEQYRFATPAWALGALVVALAAVGVAGGFSAPGRVLLGVLAAAAVVCSSTGWYQAATAFRAAPTAPMCLIVVNTGREFNGYLQALGLRSGTLFAPEIGGGALTGTALLSDGAGLAEPTIARFWARKDTAALRDYVFDQVRPTFIRAHGSFRPFMGFDADPRFQADYVLIGETPNNGGNWVRRELVPDAATMDRLREWARSADAADAAQRATPRASCGDRLAVGATGP